MQMKKLYIGFLFIIEISFIRTTTAQLVYKDVAPIFYSRCTGCHHEGQHTQSMMNFSETFPWSSAIQHDLQMGKMPVWPPDTTYTRFLHERSITASEKAAILSWIAGGSVMGDTTQAPPAPIYSQYKLYGTPDLILKIPTFTSNAGSTDAYDCFSIPTGLTQDRYLRAYEIVPGNYSVVHHVVVNVDTVGSSTNDLSGTCFNQAGDIGIGGYAPGSPPTVFPGKAQLKAGIRIKAGSKLVLQIHYPAGSAGNIDSTQIRLYFYPANTTGIRNINSSVPLQNWSLFIPANTVKTCTAKYPSGGGLPVALSMYSAFPHSHGICTSIINYADNGTDTIPLIRLNKWDFNWQGYYTYQYMKKIPAGYTLRASHVYDNTTNNPNNPNPALVISGPNTADEMLFDAFQWLYYLPGDEYIDIGALLANDSLLIPTNLNSVSALTRIKSFAYPNPFDEKVRIGYELSSPAEVSISIYNIYGSVVKYFSNKSEMAGANDIEWDGKNNAGSQLPAGIYFYAIRTCKSYSMGKMVLIQK